MFGKKKILERVDNLSAKIGLVESSQLEYKKPTQNHIIELKEHVEKLEEQVWRLQNPAKYRVGQKVGKWTVYDISVRCDLLTNQVIDEEKNKTSSGLEVFYVKKAYAKSFFWNYCIVHNDGDRLTSLQEREITSILQPTSYIKAQKKKDGVPTKTQKKIARFLGRKRKK